MAITEPFNNLAVDAPASITIAATAYDEDVRSTVSNFSSTARRPAKTRADSIQFRPERDDDGRIHRECERDRQCGRIDQIAGRSCGGRKKLSAAGAVWKFLDNGSDAGIGWRRSDFNDNGWSSGVAEFGYGDGDEATLVGYGGNAANKFVTTYFRRGFVIGDPAALTNFTVRLRCDDGAIGFLNGMEAFRSNMPEGAINYRTPAGVPLGSPHEDSMVDDCSRSRAVCFRNQRPRG